VGAQFLFTVAGKIYVPLTVSINLVNQLVQSFLVEGLAHETQDFGNHVRGDTAILFSVKGVESITQN
jgi:hypothetical protein